MKYLIFSAHVASSRIPVAGQRVFWQHLESFSESESYIIQYYNTREVDYRTDIEELYPNYLSIPHYSYNKIIGFFLGLLLGIPVDVAVRIRVRVVFRMLKLLRANPEATIVLEWQGMTWLLVALRFLKNGSKFKVIYYAHDIVSQSIERKLKEATSYYKNLYLSRELRNVRKWELLIKDKCEIRVLSEKDKALIDNGRTYIYPFQSSLAAPQNKRLESGKLNLMFLGAMNRFENKDAVNWFADNVLSSESLRDMKITLHVVGANYEGCKQFDKVKYHGYVNDLSSFSETMDAGVAPIRIGAGVKIKTIDMLALNLPLLVSDVGIEGVQFDKNDLVYVLNSEEEYIECIINMYKNKW